MSTANGGNYLFSNILQERKEQPEEEAILEAENENEESIGDNKEAESDEEGEEEENNKTMKSFTIELLIHTKVMDNREEIKNCICHNYIFNNEEEDIKENNENLFVEKEIIPNIEIPIILLKKNTKEKNELNNIESPNKFYIKMNELTKELKKMGYPMSGSMINIFVNYTNNYVYFGTEPLDNKIILYSYMLEPNKDIIKLKIINYIQKKMLDGYTNAIINTYFRKPIKTNKNKKKNKSGENSTSLDIKMYMPSMTNIEYFEKDDESSLSLDENEEDKKKYEKLTDANKRERKIGYIIEKVYAWRKLYNGYRDDDNNFIKYTLDEAAEKINVSKKSLDDYLLQIRLGRKTGFNFDDNKNEKIGVLRAHVEEQKKNSNNVIKEPIKKRKKKKKAKKEEENEPKNSKTNDMSLNMSKSKSFLGLKKNKSSKSVKSFKSFKKKK